MLKPGCNQSGCADSRCGGPLAPLACANVLLSQWPTGCSCFVRPACGGSGPDRTSSACATAPGAALPASPAAHPRPQPAPLHRPRPPPAVPSAQLPWAKRAASGDPLDTKYPYVCHAEMNALLNKNGASGAAARARARGRAGQGRAPPRGAWGARMAEAPLGTRPGARVSVAAFPAHAAVHAEHTAAAPPPLPRWRSGGGARLRYHVPLQRVRQAHDPGRSSWGPSSGGAELPSHCSKLLQSQRCRHAGGGAAPPSSPAQTEHPIRPTATASNRVLHPIPNSFNPKTLQAGIREVVYHEAKGEERRSDSPITVGNFK